MSMSSLFIDVYALPDDGFGFFQLIYLMAGYGVVLMYGASMISNGSELLLLVPEWAGIIGTVVLPVLGAVPDGAIVLFSGLGPNAQQQLDIGVGTLAGSTIMLLTIPWFLSILGGRVSIDNGKPNYEGRPRLRPSSSWLNALQSTGVTVGPHVKTGAIIMLITSTTFLVLQIPEFIYQSTNIEKTAEKENIFALIGFCIATVMFIAYLVYQMQFVTVEEDSALADKIDSVVKKSIQMGNMSVLGALAREFRAMQPEGQPTEKTGLMKKPSDSSTKRLRNILRPFFHRYDKGGDNKLHLSELSSLLSDLGEMPSKTNMEIFQKFDVDKNGFVDFEEFVQGMSFLLMNVDVPPASGQERKREKQLESGVSVVEEDEEDEEEIPEDLRSLSPAEQQRKIKLRAAWMMGIGSVLVLFFSDPMVDALGSLGDRLNIKPFYVAFVLAPLVSNGSELVAAYNYSIKKTKKSISISLTTLTGAAAMNNTFCLGIFMILVYVKELAWVFSAETVSLLIAEVIVGCMAFMSVQRLWHGLVILSVYPLSLVLVAALESAGWT
mmetsp:Transcript_28455/g.28783  ORF Transcript_28455/g.28783 Transcript_28455/m.28783 type:complete len:551 (+) Transcript_28455:102-1754(+)